MKKLVVATTVQKAVLDKVLLNEIQNGKWRDERPAGHAQCWTDVSVVVGDELGPVGFDVPRNYDFSLPVSSDEIGPKMLEAAMEVDSSINTKLLSRQMVELSRIVGGRIKKIGEKPVILNRGQENSVNRRVNRLSRTVRVPARFVD